MRLLSLTLAVFWLLQVPACLVDPGAPVHAGLGSEEAAYAHNHEGEAGGEASARPAHDSHAPASDHHSDSDGGCAQHCASLSQTLTTSLAGVPAPLLSVVAIIPLEASPDLARGSAVAVSRLELERPPPDLLARYSTLRI